MDIKDYHKTIEPKLSFEEWKSTLAPSMPDDKISAMSRLHEIDYKEQWQLTLEREYAEYLSNLNGNWLL
jgi:hypothetical protein